MKAILLVVAAIIGVGTYWLIKPDPYAREKVALSKVRHLRKGMTDIEVWKTLGLSDYGLSARPEGGPHTVWTPSYPLTPEKMLWTKWNIIAPRPLLLGAEVRPNNMGFTVRERKAAGKWW